MRKRRGRGEGSICFHESHGFWCSVLTGGYTQDGKRKRRFLYGKTKKKVQEKLLALQKEASSGALIDLTKMTVGDFLDRWLETVAMPQIRKGTYSSYELIIRVHIKPGLGGAPLRNIQPIHVQNFLHHMRKEAKEKEPVNWFMSH